MTSPRAILFEAAKIAFIQIHNRALDTFQRAGGILTWQEAAMALFIEDEDCDRKMLVRLSDGRIVQSNVDRKIGRTA